jgi:hypothetical protein
MDRNRRGERYQDAGCTGEKTFITRDTTEDARARIAATDAIRRTSRPWSRDGAGRGHSQARGRHHASARRGGVRQAERRRPRQPPARGEAEARGSEREAGSGCLQVEDADLPVLLA